MTCTDFFWIRLKPSILVHIPLTCIWFKNEVPCVIYVDGVHVWLYSLNTYRRSASINLLTFDPGIRYLSEVTLFISLGDQVCERLRGFRSESYLSFYWPTVITTRRMASFLNTNSRRLKEKGLHIKSSSHVRILHKRNAAKRLENQR